MTIAISGNFTEGVVLGADSAASYIRPRPCGKPPVSGCDNAIQSVTQVYNGAQKIYHIGRDPVESPYAGMIYGASHFAGRHWRNIFADKQMDFSACKTAQEALDQFINHLKLLCTDKDRPDGGVFFCGFGSDDLGVRSYKIDMKSLKSEEFASGVVAWDGITVVVQQLFHGMNDRTHGMLNNFIGKATMDVIGSDGKATKINVLPQILDIVRNSVPRIGLDPDMPIRDAIDYVHFLVYSTVKHFKFTHAEPVCGGDVELAIVTRDRGFRRIKTKELSSEL